MAELELLAKQIDSFWDAIKKYSLTLQDVSAVGLCIDLHRVIGVAIHRVIRGKERIGIGKRINSLECNEC